MRSPAELAEAVLAGIEWPSEEQAVEKEGKRIEETSGAERQSWDATLGSSSLRQDVFLKGLANYCRSLDQVGLALAWTFVNAATLDSEDHQESLLWKCLTGIADSLTAMRRERGRKHRSLFPLWAGVFSQMHEAAQRMSLKDFVQVFDQAEAGADAWELVSCCGVNGVAGFGRAPIWGRLTAAHKRAVGSIRKSITTMLVEPVSLERSAADAEKEIASRFISYTGEEIPKMQIIGYDQVLAALPPESHGGSIDALSLVSEGTKNFLLYPEDALISNPSPLLQLRAKVHITTGEQLPLAELLVKRRLCVWVEESEVLRVNGQKVLNGMFAVGKGSTLDDGREIQRLIMNLIPTNSVFSQAQGATSDLPSITQYLSLVLDQDETLSFYQSDMSSAFYLFRIPPAWNRMMCFDISVCANEVGLGTGGRFFLGCAVIPMGWSSAVSVMQEIADRLTVIGQLPEDHMVRRTAPYLGGWWMFYRLVRIPANPGFTSI